MTFIDVTDGPPSTGLIAGYSILCVVSLLCAYWAVNLGRSRLHYRSFFSVRVLFPLALFILALENAALAASGKIYEGLSTGSEENFDNNLFIKAVFVLQTFEVPIFLIVIFEITYLVHKRRSVNFCGMYFDEGVRVKNTAFMSCMLRNSIRSLATLLLVMGLIVNFDVIQSGESVDDLAGRAGWWALAGEDWAGKIHLLLSLIPTAVLTLVSFYLSIMLWRYGTESAMVVHSSICNPWFYSFFGTLAMAVGQLFGEELYTIMSNAGTLIFVFTILLLMAEVDKDIVATNDVACFLVQVAQKGDQTRIVESVISPSVQPPHESPFHEEEKTPEDEETGHTVLTENEKGSWNDVDTTGDQGIEASSESKEDKQDGVENTFAQEPPPISLDDISTLVECVEASSESKEDNQDGVENDVDTFAQEAPPNSFDDSSTLVEGVEASSESKEDKQDGVENDVDTFAQEAPPISLDDSSSPVEDFDKGSDQFTGVDKEILVEDESKDTINDEDIRLDQTDQEAPCISNGKNRTEDEEVDARVAAEASLKSLGTISTPPEKIDQQNGCAQLTEVDEESRPPAALAEKEAEDTANDEATLPDQSVPDAPCILENNTVTAAEVSLISSNNSNSANEKRATKNGTSQIAGVDEEGVAMSKNIESAINVDVGAMESSDMLTAT